MLELKVEKESSTAPPQVSVKALLRHPPYGAGYDVTPDGQRLVVSINEQEFPLFLPDLRIVFNWFEELTSAFER